MERGLGRWLILPLVVVLLLSTLYSGDVSYKEGEWLKLVPAGSLGAVYFDGQVLHDDSTRRILASFGWGDRYGSFMGELNRSIGIDYSRVNYGVLVVKDYEPTIIAALYVEGGFNDTARITSRILAVTKEDRWRGPYNFTYRGFTVLWWKKRDGYRTGLVVDDGFFILGDLGLVVKILNLKLGGNGWAGEFRKVVEKIGTGEITAVYNFRKMLNRLDAEPGSPGGDLAGGVDYIGFSYRAGGDNVVIVVCLMARDDRTARDLANVYEAFRLQLSASARSLGNAEASRFLSDDVSVISDGRAVLIRVRSDEERFEAFGKFLNEVPPG